MIDKIPMQDRDTKGDLYEYMLSKIATAGHNGQFRTPRHIIRLMVEMTAPGPWDKICDPALRHRGFPDGVRRVRPPHAPERADRPGTAKALSRADVSTVSTSTAPCCGLAA
jgi:type I restriction enzyme M protein